jgi:hypothetical protein
MPNKTVIALTPYLNCQAVLHPEDAQRWQDDDCDRLTALRDALIEQDLPGIELQYIGDTPSGHPVCVELIDPNSAVGEFYLQFRNDLLKGNANRCLSDYVSSALNIHNHREKAKRSI